jgi:hypothetical protein
MKVSLGSSATTMAAAIAGRMAVIADGGGLRPPFFLPDRHFPETAMQLCIALGREI